ncbi:chorismate lyase [Kingella oralis]|uniref:chorismate--pyruvate lyase family protein n=1 Tax=Kingella oralis TaxID=505 RepID=UPI002D7E6E92|nr:chorismate lyase [Kingella oralis]
MPDSLVAPDLASAQSLTAALSQRGDFSVQLDALGESVGGEGVFRLPQQQFARRVTLLLDGVAVVQAQSTCALDSAWRKWLDCGTTPLGQMLFSGCLPITRSPLQFARAEPYLLARRSTFDYAGDKLDLLECFLPEILQFAAA